MTPRFLAEVPPLDALRAHAALYPAAGLMTANVTITYAAVVADADARIEAARRTGRLEGYEQRARDAAIEASAPRELREWTAPEDGKTVRYNPDSKEFEFHGPVMGGWHPWRPSTLYALNHADFLNALRAEPYVPAPKGLREEIAEAIEARLGYTNGWSVSAKAYSEDCDKAAGDVLAIIDRERPALGEVEDDALVKELVRRRWRVESKVDVSTRCEDGYGWRVTYDRRVLIAPEPTP